MWEFLLFVLKLKYHINFKLNNLYKASIDISLTKLKLARQPPSMQLLQATFISKWNSQLCSGMYNTSRINHLLRTTESHASLGIRHVNELKRCKISLRTILN